MALKNPYMVKCVVGNTDLELEADPGEAFLVKDIRIYNPASNYITVKIDKATVGYFRVGGTLGSHLPFTLGRTKHSHDITLDSTDVTVAKDKGIQNVGGTVQNPALGVANDITSDTTYKRVLGLAGFTTPPKTILGLLRDLGVFKGFPIAEGQKLAISGAKQSGAIQLVEYEIYDPEDIRKDQQNGTESNEYVFINYGNCGGNVNKTGDTIYNTSASPAEFPDFPFGKDVPANTTIDLIGILASDFAPKENDGTNYCLTQYLKLVKERTILFDEDRNGILLRALETDAPGDMDIVGEGMSLIGNYSDVDAKMPLIFPTPITFNAGEELGVYLTTTKGGTGQNIATDEHEIGLILKVAIGGR